MVAEPLAESAPLARSLAAAHCADRRHGYPCRAYHGFWQYLRLLGLGKTLSGMSGRYLAALAEFLDERNRRGCDSAPSVLVSGCADYSSAAHVLHACRAASVDPRITALDLCPTPLALNRWYADRSNAEIRTVEGNILDQPGEGRFDLIVTSSFLGYFEPAARPRLFATFSTLLRRDGSVIFANRLRAQPEATPVGFDAAQVARFAGRAAELSGRLPSRAALSAEDARAAAEAYARDFRAYPVNSAATVRALAEAAGLEWLGGDVAPTRAHAAGVSGPTLSDGSDYLFVRLRKQ